MRYLNAWGPHPSRNVGNWPLRGLQQTLKSATRKSPFSEETPAPPLPHPKGPRRIPLAQIGDDGFPGNRDLPFRYQRLHAVRQIDIDA
jgi:hypothetical protein